MPEVNTYAIGLSYNVVSSCTTNTGITAASYSTFGIRTPAIIRTIEIPPFNFSSGDIVTFEAVMSKQNTNGGYYYSIYWNTNGNLTNARKVWEPVLIDDTDTLVEPTWISSTLTYSSVYFRMEIRDELTDTRTLDPHRIYTNTIATPGGLTNDLFYKSYTSGNEARAWERVGTQEGLTSIDWTHWNSAFTRGGFFIIAGEVQNSSDILRCEWIKISGLSSATFEDPVSRLG